MPPQPQWLTWAQNLAAIAQNGLAYSTNPFDIERFHQLRGIAAEILAAYSQTDLPVVQNLLDAQSGYTTPKVDCRGVVFQNGKLLMVRELIDGRWTLPGGWVDVNEPPGLAVAREVREEAGYDVRAVKLLMLYDRASHPHPPYIFSVYKLFFLCELLGEAEAKTNETADATFFAPDELPPLSLERVTPDELERIFEHYRNPDLPTDFD